MLAHRFSFAFALDKPKARPCQGDATGEMMFTPESLTYDSNGLIPCIAQDHRSGAVLMLAWMNAAAVAQTLASGRVTYWSRSRAALWVKGETSGHQQRLVELRLDCDRDCLLALVEQTGPACHTNRPSCFYTAIRAGAEVELTQPI
jgi:phosphoribosyl-AMP cyclohydrolase